MRLIAVDGEVRLDPTDPDLRLTETQRAALATDRELVLTAGAGTGKTQTLSLRYVALLLALANRGESDVERVLVLTFTEKAAHEMAERCHRQLRSLIAAARRISPTLEEGRGPALVAALERMEDSFDRARIGTFHGFCARLLREFPAETGTPPGASPLPGAEAGRWIDAALAEALDVHLAADPDDLGPLLDTFGTRAGLLEAGRIAIDRLGILDELLVAHADGAIRLDDLLRASRPTPAEAEQWTRTVGLPSLQLLARLVAPSGGGPFVEQVLKPALSSPPASGPLAVYGRYRDVLEALITDAGTLRSLDHHSIVGLRDAWPDERRYKQAKDAARVLGGRLADWPDRVRAARRLPTEADRALLEALTPFSRWVRAAAVGLGRTLDRRRRITFEEMQRRAIRAVLADDELRTTLRERFRYLMVDEFQDTDERQWALVRALGRDDPRVAEDRIFLVGDPKQAIYGFRGGDVTVFRRAIDELRITPIALAENFRSKPELIGWFNAVFPKVLDAGTPYEPLTARRTEGGGGVTLLRGPQPFDAPDQAARWIAASLAGSELADRDRHPTPPIAILLRSRTRQDRYEAALGRYGVPYVVASGVGFWIRPEVVDVVNLVCAVAHGDPISVVGALRSPLLGLTDQQVQDLGVRAIPERWLARRREVGPSSLVREIVAEGVPVWAAMDPSGQAQANVDRLAELVAPWDALGLAAVADRLVTEVESASRESEAALVPTEARVLLCTVHAAKGLEFPVVVVPELSARPANDAPTLLVARLDGRFRIASQVLDPEAAVETRTRPGLYSALAQIRRTEQDAEERRLLYVAATRARDRLVLVGVEQPAAEPGARPTWMQLVESALPRGTEVLGDVPPPPALVTDVSPPPAPVPWVPPAPRRALELSASALDRFVGCPARWMRGDLLGIPESPASARDRAQALAAARGQILHQVLEDRVEADPAAIRTRWAAAAGAIAASREEAAEGYDRLVAHLAVTSAEPEVRRALAAPGWSELPFRATHGGIVLHGRIDRLWLDREAGGFVVLDWKSEALHGRTPEAVARRHETQLRAYAWAADRVCRARGQGRVVRGDIVLTEVGRVVSAGPWSDGDLDDVPALLERIATVAERPWAEVEAASTAGDVPRPCGECGFAPAKLGGRSVRGAGCRGVS